MRHHSPQLTPSPPVSPHLASSHHTPPRLTSPRLASHLKPDHQQAAMQPCSQAARQPGSQAARQPGSQAARQPGSQAARQAGSQAARKPGSQAAGSLAKTYPVYLSSLNTYLEEQQLVANPVLEHGSQRQGFSCLHNPANQLCRRTTGARARAGARARGLDPAEGLRDREKQRRPAACPTFNKNSDHVNNNVTMEARHDDRSTNQFGQTYQDHTLTAC